MVMVEQVKEQLRAGLSTLPTPRNDYEIVVPEDEVEGDSRQSASQMRAEDQADVDQRAYDTMVAKSQYHFLFINILFVGIWSSMAAIDGLLSFSHQTSCSRPLALILRNCPIFACLAVFILLTYSHGHWPRWYLASPTH